MVFTDVSSIKTRWVESSSLCLRIQRPRARATSARSCSLAYSTFFKSDAVPLQKPKQRRAVAGIPFVRRAVDFDFLVDDGPVIRSWRIAICSGIAAAATGTHGIGFNRCSCASPMRAT